MSDIPDGFLGDVPHGLTDEGLEHLSERFIGVGRHNPDCNAGEVPKGNSGSPARPHLIATGDPDNRVAWLASRQLGLGGSDMAAILGEDSFRSEVDVWLSKLEGFEERPDDGERRESGKLLEPVVLGWYARGGEQWPAAGDRGQVLLVKPPQVAHRDRLWHRGSADGLVIADRDHDLAGHVLDMASVSDYGLGDIHTWVIDHGAEVKTHGWAMSRRYGRPGEADEIPGDKRIQCAWYQSLWDVEEWKLIALLDTHLRREWPIHRDRQFEADLLEIAEAWWNRHIVKGEEPRPDGSKSYGEHLRRKYPADNGSVVVATPELDATAARLRRLRRLEKRVERERDRCEQKLQDFLGDASVLESAAGKITFKAQAGAISWKAVAEQSLKDQGLSLAERDERAEAHRGKPFRVLRVPSDFTK